MKHVSDFLSLPKLLAAAAVLSLITLSTPAQRSPTLTGDIRVHKEFHSNVMNNDRDILVYLPPHYQTGKKRYPVLYLNDGQNLFDGATSFIPGQEWRIDETAESLITSGEIEPLIIVGIYNKGKERVDEYTPERDDKYKAGGRADIYGRMLVEELKPFIDKTYRTRKEAKDTGLGGSSLGGILSLYLGLKYKDVFSKLAIVSPSVFFANKEILRFVESQPYSPNTRIWLDIGTKEGRDVAENNETVQNTHALKEALERKGWKPEKELRYFEAEGAGHNEQAWAARFSSILKFLYPAKK